MPDRSIFIQTFDQWAVSVDDVSVSIGSKKSRALFAYLIFSDRKEHTREQLANLLWPDVGTQSARGSLRQSLLLIKRGLGSKDAEVLNATKDAVFVDASHIGSDVDELFDALRSGKPILQSKLRQFSSEHFLAAFDGVSDGFSEWLSQRRSALENAFLKALKFALTAKAHDADTLHGIALLLRELDEFDEQAVRFLMTRFREKNELPSALRLYQQLFDALEREMDAEPSPETQALVIEIKMIAPAKPAQMNGHATPKIEPRIAVLPFETIGHDEIDRYVILGLLDDLTCQLVRLRSVAVISSNSTRSYFGSETEIRKVGAELGVQYVVTGNVRRHGSRVAVMVQLVAVETLSVIDARGHDCAYEEILSLNSSIAASIANFVVPNISRVELAKTRALPANSLAPYLLVMRAKEKLFALSRGDFDEAGRVLDQAIDSAPNFAPSFALKAEWYSIKIWQRWSDAQDRDYDALNECANLANSISGTEPRVLALIGHNRVLMKREFDEASEAFEIALSDAPNDADVLALTVPSLTFMGDAARAIANAERALALSPQDPFLFRNTHFLGIARYAAGDYEGSVEAGLQCYQSNPNYISNIRMTVAAMHAAGMTSQIAPLLEQHDLLVPNFQMKNYGDGPPFRDQEQRKALLADLAGSGLPV